MKTFYTLTTIAGISSGLLALAISWASGIDYSSPYTSMMPMGIALIVGLVTAGVWGGVIGAWLDYKEESKVI
jgi:hypothetical protein